MVGLFKEIGKKAAKDFRNINVRKQQMSKIGKKIGSIVGAGKPSSRNGTYDIGMKVAIGSMVTTGALTTVASIGATEVEQRTAKLRDITEIGKTMNRRVY